MARRSVKRIAIGLALLACCGCGDREGGEIRAYEVPKEEPPPTGRMPGPVDLAAGTGAMEWDLPAGWQPAANPNTMRFATLIAGGPGPDDAIEVAITRLAGAAGGVAANVNFWRQQVGLPPVAEADVESLIVPLEARGAEGVMVDLVGAPAADGQPTPRMLAAIFPAGDSTWFIKTINSEAALQQHRDAFVEFCRSVRFGAAGGMLPPGHPPMPSTPAAAAPPPPAGRGPGAPIWASLPEGWSPSDAPVAMSVASFIVGEGDESATVTITPLGGAQDLLSNVNRWRRQVGLGPLASLQDDPPAAIDVGGEPGSLVDVAGADTRTLAAVGMRAGTTWFIKLSGPPAVVAAQKQAFEAFVGSIRFEGAPDA